MGSTLYVLFCFVGMVYFIQENKELYTKAETVGSMLVGVGNVAIAFALKFILLYLVIWVYNLVPWRMYFSWWSFIPCYIIFDFCSYWVHTEYIGRLHPAIEICWENSTVTVNASEKQVKNSNE